MSPKPGDVYVAQVDYGAASYPRPCIILGLYPNGRYMVAPISSKMDLYEENSADHVRFSRADPGFDSSGLDRESYADLGDILEIDSKQLMQPIGKLRGDLLASIEKALGPL